MTTRASRTAITLCFLLVSACSSGDSVTAPDPIDRPPATSVAADSAAVLAVVRRLDVAWVAMDAAAWTREFTADAQFVNILGQTLNGATAIQERHVVLFGGPFKGSKLESTVTRLKFVGPAAAIVECNQNLTGYVALPPGTRETAPGVLRTRMIHLLSKVGTSWQIVSSQNTAVSP